jgi:hypothetical protein
MAPADILAPVVNQPTKLDVSTPLSKSPPTGVKVVGLNDGIEIENLTYAGLAAAAKALNWNFSTQSINDNNIQTVISAATSAINAGAKVVVMISQLQSTIDQILPIAKQHGAIILDAISSNSAHDGQILAATSSHEGTQKGRYGMAEILQQATAAGDTAPSIAESWIPQFATAGEPIENGLKEVMTANCPKCTLDRINVSFQEISSGKTAQVVTSYLQTHPNVKYLFFAANFFEAGLIPALQQAGIKVPVIVGSDPTAAQITSIKNGANEAWLYGPQNVLGWVFADELARYFVGDNYNVWNTSAYAPAWMITQKNVSQITNVNDLAFPAGYQDMFKQMWHVS